MWKLTISDVKRQELDPKTHAVVYTDMDRKAEVHVKNTIRLALTKNQVYSFTMEETGEAPEPSFKRPPRVFYNRNTPPKEIDDDVESTKKKSKANGRKKKSRKTNNKKRTSGNKPSGGADRDDRHDGAPEGEPEDI